MCSGLRAPVHEKKSHEANRTDLLIGLFAFVAGERVAKKAVGVNRAF
jgi:hypothetical protein